MFWGRYALDRKTSPHKLICILPSLCHIFPSYIHISYTNRWFTGVFLKLQETKFSATLAVFQFIQLLEYAIHLWAFVTQFWILSPISIFVKQISKLLTVFMTTWLSISWKLLDFLNLFWVLCEWFTRPEKPKGAKDKVKRPQRPPVRSQGPEGPSTSIFLYCWFCKSINLGPKFADKYF